MSAGARRGWMRVLVVLLALVILHLSGIDPGEQTLAREDASASAAAEEAPPGAIPE